MSTRASVNLLPREVAEKAAGRRTAIITGVVFLLFLVVLAFIYIAKLGDVSAAQEERDAEQAEVARLQSELASLQEFATLRDRLATRQLVLASAMAREVSTAQVLNDISLSFPGTAALRELTYVRDVTPAADGTTLPIEPAVEGEGPSIANVAFEGYSVERYAPGVETVLLQFDGVDSFFDAYVTTAQDELIGEESVTQFTGSVELDPSAYTRRYENGLPPTAEGAG